MHWVQSEYNPSQLNDTIVNSLTVYCDLSESVVNNSIVTAINSLTGNKNTFIQSEPILSWNNAAVDKSVLKK